MASAIVEPTRIHRLDDGRSPARGGHVLYWMQSAVRTFHNQALEYAARRANHHGVPLLVCFGIDDGYPESSARHHRFMLEGLAAVAPTLDRRRIGFRVERGSPPAVAAGLAHGACEVVTDRGYLAVHRAWRRSLVSSVQVPVTEVETNLVVPVETASDKREYAARTLRPKIHRHLEDHLVELATTPLDHDGRPLGGGVDVSRPEEVLAALDVDRSVPPTDRVRGGEHRARATLDRFLGERLEGYGVRRGEPALEATSGLSPYLHFGHLSPVAVVLAARRISGGTGLDYDTLVEELVVRRELAHNYVWFEPEHESYTALPQWARATLDRHRDDPRSHVYTRAQLEAGETHDRYWNAAMAEMRETGYLHNHMRMYWGKQIIMWTNTPEFAHQTALHLNNRYLLDGRDPNSYANIGWLFGLHDRPWQERDVVGTVRSMTSGGLERKKDPDGYVALVERLASVSLADSGD